MSDTQQIKDNLDIVDLVGEYVQLKPAGSNHKGLCPFHNEKSPSFMVSRDRQSWRCFGCSKGGDIFSFVQDIEGMEFVEALKLLADKAGITLTQSFSQNKGAGEKKVRLKTIMDAATHFYYQFLLKMDLSADARTYLEERGLTAHTIDVWKVGFVPDQWDLLTKYLLKKGFSIDDMVAAGLTIKRDGANRGSGKGYYDRFRGRVMFPICDAQGNPVGVTGRVLVETEKSGGKYVNTPQTDIYDKSNILYGLDKAKGAIRKTDQVVVVEGQMDVLAVWQSGMEQVVASSGTALTAEQIKLMKRYTKNIAMAFDTDAAGLKAAKRGIALALEAGMSVRVIQIPEDVAKDPDECVKTAPDVWKACVDGATDVLTWYIDQSIGHNDLTDPHGKQAVANEVLPEIARIPYAVERDHWLGELSMRTGIERSVLKEDMTRLSREQVKKQPRKKTNVAIPDNAPPPIGESSSYVSTPQHAPPIEAVQSRLDTLLREWFSLLLSQPDLKLHTIPHVQCLDQLSPEIEQLYKQAKVAYTAEHQVTTAILDTSPQSPLVSELLLLGDHRFSELGDRDQQHTLDHLSERIQETDVSVHRAGLIAALGAAEANGDTETVAKILSALQ